MKMTRLHANIGRGRSGDTSAAAGEGFARRRRLIARWPAWRRDYKLALNAPCGAWLDRRGNGVRFIDGRVREYIRASRRSIREHGLSALYRIEPFSIICHKMGRHSIARCLTKYRHG